MTPSCDWCGECVWCDPYAEPVQIQGHTHAEPVCAWPDCHTFLTREQMRDYRAQIHN